uniref:Macaca fascicularis brain cDNA clone: QflA-19487, similar to human ubiquitination factor E4B (UFD2 homolog, yeast) (UBE4B), mRNA, RefSeq: NM_006048.2 n=1 Tax=Macaca fascicularis TaxID=9541 RepID=I7GN53_MACFA|nr:unnamed protein product [Macaca fascicularis]
MVSHVRKACPRWMWIQELKTWRLMKMIEEKNGASVIRSLPRALKCLKSRPYSWSVRSSVSLGRTGTEMSSFFLLFLHSLSRTQKKCSPILRT